ncbi:class I SAM-dependent methyltransferase [Pseudalkalibacillus sp. Hm43]|uniref:class I SAM-dependent methyltransferase n=1 Tax=Pseudalkalibacillus sp. Hm43 TaxID=3450742 RepID=UPI003F43C810
MIITTGGKAKIELKHRAKEVGNELGIPYVDRQDRSIDKMMDLVEDGIIVVRRERFLFYPKGSSSPVFFHPNSSLFRIKRLMRGEDDPLVRNARLREGMSILDCTLGWASDSIVASFVVGKNGKVVGIEGSSTIALLTTLGLKVYEDENPLIYEAMRRVEVKEGDHLDYLRQCQTDSFDVVYFDPMFEETIVTSDGIAPLKDFAVYEPISEEIIEEAKRVARERVVLKDHYKSNRFAQFGFDVEIRKTSAFHFGHIKVK